MRLRIGVLGCASIAKRLMIPAIKGLQSEFELVAVASRERQKAEEFGKLFDVQPVEGYDNLIARKDIDVVYMPLPTGIHEEWITKCLDANKHVLVEKSLAIDIESATRLCHIAQKKKLLLMENFMFLYHSQHALTWRLITQDEIGEIRLFRSQFGFPPLDKSTFRYDKRLGGGSLLDAAAYTVRAAQWFLKTKLTVAAAMLYVDRQTGVDIYGNATLVGENGVTAQISFGFDNYYQCNYELWGSKGRIFAERAFTPKPDETPRILQETQGHSKYHVMAADNHFANLLRSLHASINENRFERFIPEILVQSAVLTEIKNIARTVTI